MDTHDQQQPADVPPPSDQDMEEDVYDEDVIPQTKWPKVIGVISLLYAIIGMTCQVVWGAWMWVGVWLQQKFSNIDVNMPALVKYPAFVMMVLAFILGWILLIGSINLLRRKRKGVAQLKVWVVLRLLLLLLGLAVTVLTFPINMEFQRDLMDKQIAQAKRQGQPTGMMENMRDKMDTVGMASTAGITVVIAIYPLFLGVYISRKKVTEEIHYWP